MSAGSLGSNSCLPNFWLISPWDIETRWFGIILKIFYDGFGSLHVFKMVACLSHCNKLSKPKNLLLSIVGKKGKEKCCSSKDLVNQGFVETFDLKNFLFKLVFIELAQ